MYVYIATIPLTLIVTVFAIPSEINRPIEYWYWTLIGLLSHLTMLPFVLYGLKIKKIQIQIPLLLAMGLVRGVTIGVLQPIFGFKDEMIIPVRALISMLISFICFMLSQLFIILETNSNVKFMECLSRELLKTSG
jgi:hypothetical protein